MYTLPFTIFSLLAAPFLARPATRRPLLLGLAVFVASSTFGVAGVANSFVVFAAMRAL